MNIGGRLSQSELRERSHKGLCFKCGETWRRDHVCKLKHYQFVLMEKSEEEVVEESETEAETEVVLSAKVMQLSLKSKEGLTSNRSFKILGRINGVEVLILVDCGASSNFISKKLVEKLKLKVHKTPEFVVEVGNGERVKHEGVCQDLVVEVQGVSIMQHFFLMELGGTDLVLGMDWLASLGDMRANFRNLVLCWGKGDEEKVVKGDPSLCKAQASWKALMKAIQDEWEEYVLSYYDKYEPLKDIVTVTDSSLESVLQEFEQLFREPTTLPPS